MEIDSTTILCLKFKYFSKCVIWISLAPIQTTSSLFICLESVRKVISSSLQQNYVTLDSNHVLLKHLFSQVSPHSLSLFFSCVWHDFSTISCCSTSFLKFILCPERIEHSCERLSSIRQCKLITLQIHICSWLFPLNYNTLCCHEELYIIFVAYGHCHKTCWILIFPPKQFNSLLVSGSLEEQ